MRMSVRTIVLFGALAWVSGSLLVIMHRGVLAEGRVAGVSDTATATITKAPRIPVGNAIVSLTNDRTMYLRRDSRVWRILDLATLQLLATLVPDREGRQNLDGLTLVGVVNTRNARDILSERIPDPILLPGSLSVRVDATNPAAATLADGTLLNPVLAIQLRSLSNLPMSITGLTFTQQFAQLVSTSTSTLPSSTVFSGVTAWEGTTRHGSRSTFGQNLRATVDMAADPIVLPARGIKVLMIKADSPADTLARMGDYGVRLAVTAVADITQTGGLSVSGIFPLRGNLFSWVDGENTLGQLQAVGEATAGYATEPSTTTEPNILTGVYPDLFHFRLLENSAREDLAVQSIMLNVEGTINPAVDLQRLQLVAGGGVVATATAAVGGTVTFNLPGVWIIPAGTNRLFSVTADIVGGVGHWFRFNIADQNSLLVRGNTTGVYIEPTATSWPVVSEPGYWQIGSQSTSTETILVSRSPWLGSNGTTVNPGEHQAPLAAYIVTNPIDEMLHFDVAVLNFEYATSTATSTLTNFALYRVDRASGTAEMITQTVSAISGQAINLYPSDDVWLEPQAAMDLELRANVSGSALPGELLTSSMPAWGIGMSAVDGQQYTGPISTVIGQPVVVQIPTFSISSVNSSPDTLSSIILAGTQDRLIQTLRLTAFTEDGHLTLNKLTLQFDSSGGTATSGSGVLNLSTVRLYHNDTLLGTSYPSSYGTTTADYIFTFATPIEVPAWAPYDIDVKVDLHNSGTGPSATQLMARIKSNSNVDLEVRSESGGLLPPSYVNIGPLNTPSSWFLVHDTAPTITALPLTPHVISTNDEIARFEVRNFGQVPMKLDNLNLSVAATGLASNASHTATDTVSNFELYINDTAIATPVVARTLQPGSLTAQLTFNSSTSINGGWEEWYEIPVGVSRVYSLRANTLLVNASGVIQPRTLQAQVPGMRGHIEDLNVYEPNWAYGGVVYRYRPLEQTVWHGPYSASDSYPVLGMVASYN